MTAFSITEKIFSKIENLICVLRAHINRTLSLIRLLPIAYNFVHIQLHLFLGGENPITSFE